MSGVSQETHSVLKMARRLLPIISICVFWPFVICLFLNLLNEPLIVDVIFVVWKALLHPLQTLFIPYLVVCVDRLIAFFFLLFQFRLLHHFILLLFDFCLASWRFSMTLVLFHKTLLKSKPSRIVFNTWLLLFFHEFLGIIKVINIFLTTKCGISSFTLF